MKRLVSGVFVLGLLSLPATAQAELIEGRFGFTLAEVVVSLGEIDWVPPINPGLDATPTYGTFEINPAGGTRDGVFDHADFAVLNELDDIQDMSNNPADANYFPVGTLVNNTDFFLLNDRPDWNFTATFLLEGDFGTPFDFLEAGGSTSVTMTIFGIAWDDDTPTLISNWTAIITAQYAGWTIQEMLDCLTLGLSTGPEPCEVYTTGPGGVPTSWNLPENNWSGDFIATSAEIPEPTTLLLFGTGAAAMAIRRRRQNRKA